MPKRNIEKTTEKHDIQRTMNENMRKFAPFPPILGPKFKETTLPNGGDDLLQFLNLCFTDSVFKFLEMETNSKGSKTKHTKMPRSKGMLTCANEMKKKLFAMGIVILLSLHDYGQQYPLLVELCPISCYIHF